MIENYASHRTAGAGLTNVYVCLSLCGHVASHEQHFRAFI